MKTHYTAKELAGLPGLEITERAIRDKAERESWESQKRAGKGGGWEYALASLPAATRKALATLNTTVGYDSPGIQAATNYAAQIQLSAEEKERQRQKARAESLAMFNRLPDWKKQTAKAKLAIITACHHYIVSHRLAKTAGQNSFAHEYNLGRIDVAPWVRTEIGHLHPGTLRKWITEEYELGVMGLVDCYGNRKGQSKIETYFLHGQDGRPVMKRREDDTSEPVAPMAEKIQALLLTYTKIGEADREGLEVADTTFQLASGATGDDELVVEFS
ncbi:MAG: hypothetical protein A2X58_08585 [Nitrospirae bacterium GWC2_56_14]|nr:MAG: hypothetical protein A2X58_08585 [Nitrospirae bacterium GWC2_56_14]